MAGETQLRIKNEKLRIRSGILVILNSRNDPIVYPNGNSGTYHWDLHDTQHGGEPHHQVHEPDGTIIRIMFKIGK